MVLLPCSEWYNDYSLINENKSAIMKRKTMYTIIQVLAPFYRYTDRQTHDDGKYPRIASAARLKMVQDRDITTMER